MKKSIFKVGDKVFDIHRGWGIVDLIIEPSFFPINVKFGESSNVYTWDGRSFVNQKPLLSFTEYTLDGFSQERPEELPNKGQIVWGRNEFPCDWHIGYFFEKRGDKYLMNSHPNPTGWHIEVIEITTENPYKDE